MTTQIQEATRNKFKFKKNGVVVGVTLEATPSKTLREELLKHDADAFLGTLVTRTGSTVKTTRADDATYYLVSTDTFGAQVDESGEFESKRDAADALAAHVEHRLSRAQRSRELDTPAGESALFLRFTRFVEDKLSTYCELDEVRKSFVARFNGAQVDSTSDALEAYTEKLLQEQERSLILLFVRNVLDNETKSVTFETTTRDALWAYRTALVNFREHFTSELLSHSPTLRSSNVISNISRVERTNALRSAVMMLDSLVKRAKKILDTKN